VGGEESGSYTTSICGVADVGVGCLGGTGGAVSARGHIGNDRGKGFWEVKTYVPSHSSS
jgi:hypothetical protein